MLLVALAFITFTPQEPSSSVVEPSVAETVRAIHVEQEAAAAAHAVVAFRRAIGDPEIRGAGEAQLGQLLRDSGFAAIDDLRKQTAGFTAEVTPLDSLDVVAAQWLRRVPQIKPKRLDLRGFEKLCERVHRDIVDSVGSGREIDATAAKLHAMIDRLRLPSALDEWDKATRQLVEERVARVGRVDRGELLSLARQLTAAALLLDDPKLIKKMEHQQAGRPRESVKGDVFHDRETSFGRLVVGGFGANEYDCSQIDVVIDFGGDDVYRGPAGGTGEMRRLAVVIDLAGDDRYQALNSGLGSGTYGVGLLLDFAGNDVYRGGDRCLGFGAAGVGIWLDLAGDDDVEVGSLSVGVGLAGLGFAADFGGADKQVAGTESFGCGLPGGLGVFFDRVGADERRAAARSIDLYGRTESISLAFGVGLGGWPRLPGGAGLCVDLAGADTYEAAGIALGAGVLGGCGAFRDVAGDDRYQVGFGALGAAFDAGVGIACDDGGNDSYSAGGLSLGAAIHRGVAMFCDARGADSYRAAAFAFGAARRASAAVFLDRGDVDAYSHHAGEFEWSTAAEAFDDSIALFVDEGGAIDKYAEGATVLADAVQVLETDWADGRERRIVVDR